MCASVCVCFVAAQRQHLSFRCCGSCAFAVCNSQHCSKSEKNCIINISISTSVCMCAQFLTYIQTFYFLLTGILIAMKVCLPTDLQRSCFLCIANSAHWTHIHTFTFPYFFSMPFFTATIFFTCSKLKYLTATDSRKQLEGVKECNNWCVH